MRNENKKEQTMKSAWEIFTQDEEYDFVFTSESFMREGELMRWSYHNMYKFSNVDKSTCAYTGKKCNFNEITLEYYTDVQGEKKWIEYEEFEPCVTKKDMMELITNVTNS